jgi:hypothetical protein
MLELEPALGVAKLDHTAQPSPWRGWDVRGALVFGTSARHFSATVQECARALGGLTPTWLARIGEAAMTGVLNDLLLFSCLAAFVTGVVIAAATILI